MKTIEWRRIAVLSAGIMLVVGYVYSGIASIGLYRRLFARPIVVGASGPVDAYLAPVGLSSVQQLQHAVQRANWSSGSDVVFLAEASVLSRQDLYQVDYTTSYALYPTRVWLASWCDSAASAAQCEITNARPTAGSAIAEHSARHVVLIGRSDAFPHARRQPISDIVSLLELP